VSVTVEQFVNDVQRANILSPIQLQAARHALPPECRDDAKHLARELLRQKALTEYQLQEAYLGNAKNLVLGNYVILEKIGEGGMGQVFRARHRRMDRMVAIKMLPSGIGEDSAAVERFKREVKAAAKMNHPNIVTAYDADEADGRHFLVMEYVEGTDLSALVRSNGPLPVDEAVECALQAARGLEYAHRRGVVHRDIKPANLLLDREGTVKLLDMGLARLEPAAGVAESELTGTGQMMGTVDYMSPEQAFDTKHADEGSDVYSLGCALWYLLTGRSVFAAEGGVMKKLLAHRERSVPSLQSACAAATPALEGVFAKMLAKQPGDRYQTMAEVIDGLAHCGVRMATWRGLRTPSAETALDDESRLEKFLGEVDSMRPPTAANRAIGKKTPTPAGLKDTVAFISAAFDSPPFNSAHVEPDSNSEPSLDAPAAETTRQRGVHLPNRRSRTKWLAGAGVALFAAAFVLLVDSKDGAIRVAIHDPQIEVAVKGTEIVLKQPDQGHDVRLTPGEKVLVVRRGDLKFETASLVVKKGDTIAVDVVIAAGIIEVREGARMIGHATVPARWRGWPADAPPAAIAPFDTARAMERQDAWATYLNVDVERENTVGMKLRLVPPGEFAMGSRQEEVDALAAAATDQWWKGYLASEAPKHAVYLTKPFYLGLHEVTQEEFEKVMAVNPSYYSAGGPGKDAVARLNTGEHPVEMVCWFDAVDFCNKLSEQEGLAPYYFHQAEVVNVMGGDGYRLPTEAEWEFASRAGTSTRWSFGDDDAVLRQHGWINTNAGGRTQPVGKLAANPFGLLDMYGNVWEWCWDRHAHYDSSPVPDPTGPKGGVDRVLRGGTFKDEASFARSANRPGNDPSSRDSTYGFRVARSYR
jgi:serine/threonine protein kinase/formylglycine-generating enzyme required for sulfatase activity